MRVCFLLSKYNRLAALTMIIVFVCCCYLCLYDIKMCSMYERALFYVVWTIRNALWVYFFLIILIRNPLEYMDGIISFFIGIVRFLRPSTNKKKKLSHENKRRLIHLPSKTIEDKSEVGGPQKPHYTNKERYYSIHIFKRISNKYY